MSSEITVTARLNDKCQPEFRVGLFDDPLDSALRAEGIGGVDGGGTQIGPDGEIAYCEMVIVISRDEGHACKFLIDKLNELGAPKGSSLRYGTTEVPFGVNEGMAVYLNGTELEPDVYRSHDINVVIEEMLQALQGDGQLHGYMEGATETALYFYGPSFEVMVKRTRFFVETYPLCQRARILQVA